MKKTLTTALLIVVSLSSLLFSTAPAFATPDEDHKVIICHGTGSESNPFVEIPIDKHALKSHFKDGHQEGEDTFGPCLTNPAPKPTETAPPVKETAAPVPTKGVEPTTNPTPTDHAEPNPSGSAEATEQAYPAPSVTPNTVNGVVPASANPTPAPTSSVISAAAVTDRLPNTGANDWLYIWGAVGVLIALAGLASVIWAKRKAA